MSEVEEALIYLEELQEDQDTSKRVKELLEGVRKILIAKEELSVQKALIKIEEISSNDLPSYHRTALLEIASLLEAALAQ